MPRAGERQKVLVVDDDSVWLRQVQDLLKTSGFCVRTFDSPLDFLARCPRAPSGCLILGLRMREINGLTVLGRLADQGISLPTIMVTRSGDIRSCSLAFRTGAYEFFEKSVDPEELLAAVRNALARDKHTPGPLPTHRLSCPDSLSLNVPPPREADETAPGATRDSAEVLSSLTARQRRVYDLLMAGLTLKEIAARLHITVQATWKHQDRILAKFGAENVIQLLQQSLRASRTSSTGTPD